MSRHKNFRQLAVSPLSEGAAGGPEAQARSDPSYSSGSPPPMNPRGCSTGCGPLTIWEIESFKPANVAIATNPAKMSSVSPCVYQIARLRLELTGTIGLDAA